MKNSDIRYIVNEENKTVTAILEGCMYDVMDDIIRHGFYNNESLGISYDPAKLILPNRIVAVAKCHEDDTFDVHTGKVIACRKVTKKYYDAKRTKMNHFIKDLNTLSNRLSSYSATLEGKE